MPTSWEEKDTANEFLCGRIATSWGGTTATSCGAMFQRVPFLQFRPPRLSGGDKDVSGETFPRRDDWWHGGRSGEVRALNWWPWHGFSSLGGEVASVQAHARSAAQNQNHLRRQRCSVLSRVEITEATALTA